MLGEIMQPNNPLDPQNQQSPVPATPPLEPQPVPMPPVVEPPQPPVAPQPAPTPEYAPAPQPAPVTPPHPYAQAPAPGPVPPVMPGAPVPGPLGSMPAGPEAPQPNFLDKLKSNKKLLIKVAIIAAIAIVLIVGVVVAARFLPSNPVTNFLTGTKGVTLEDYSNSDIGISMKVPEGWTVDENTDQTYVKSVSFQEPVAELDDKSDAGKYRGIVSVNLTDYSSSEYLSMEEDKFFENAKESIKAGLDAASDSDTSVKYDIQSEDTIDLNGNKAYKVKLKISNFGEKENEVGYMTRMSVYVSEKYQYTVMIAAHESDKGVVDQFDTILGSFKTTL